MKKFLIRYVIPCLPPLAYVMWVVMFFITATVINLIRFFNSDFDSGEGSGLVIVIFGGLITYIIYWLGIVLNTIKGIFYFRKSTGRQMKLLSLALIMASLAQIYFLIGFRSTGLAVFGIVNWFTSSDSGPMFGVRVVLPFLLISVPLLDWMIRRYQKRGYLFRKSYLNEGEGENQ